MSASLFGAVRSLLFHHETKQAPAAAGLKDEVLKHDLPLPAAEALVSLIAEGVSPLTLAQLLLGFIQAQDRQAKPAVPAP